MLIHEVALLCIFIKYNCVRNMPSLQIMYCIGDSIITVRIKYFISIKS